MPKYAKRYRSRRNYRKRSSPSTKRIANIARAVARKEDRKNEELKIIDTSTAWASVSSSGQFYLLSPITMGAATAESGVGDIIHLHNLHVRFQLKSSTSNYSNVRIIFFQWFVPSTYDAPALTDLLDTSSNVEDPFQPYPTLNILNQERRVKILWDRVYQTKPMEVSGTSTSTTRPSVKIKLNNFVKKLESVNTASTGGLIGNIYMLTFSDDALTDYPDITYQSRLTFSG